jgi:hypothetical protein
MHNRNAKGQRTIKKGTGSENIGEPAKSKMKWNLSLPEAAKETAKKFAAKAC